MPLRPLTEAEFLHWRTANGFKNRQWRFAATVHRPLPERLPWFVQTLLAPLPPLRQAVLHASAIIFPPRRLTAMREAVGIVQSVYKTPALLVDSIAELGPLLEAALFDGVDCVVLPRPTPFVLAADHHDWTRIFAMSKSHLAPVLAPLIAAGIEVLEPAHRLHGLPQVGPRL
jgi:hypothetical protein